MDALQKTLPGFLGLNDFVSEKPFEKMERVLWVRPH